jgi:hypothetical protein
VGAVDRLQQADGRRVGRLEDEGRHPMTWNGNRDCLGCRYWSEMVAQAGAGTENDENGNRSIFDDVDQ